MKNKLLILTILAAPGFLPAASIHGTVVDSNGGEPLQRVRIRVITEDTRTVTDHRGEFTISGVKDGTYRIEAETVGYHLATLTLAVNNGEDATVRIVLTPDSLKRTDSITVTASTFEGAVSGAPSQNSLSGNDLRNLSDVIVDDPLRSLASLPGVFAGNDYLSSFSVRGAPFGSVGIYLDGVLMRTAAHSFGGDMDGFSISTLNDQTLDGVTLLPGAYPPEFGDRIGAALAVETRDGSAKAAVFRLSVGMSDVSGVAEGPMGSRGTWLIAARKSYLGYAIGRLGGNGAEALSFDDMQAKLSYRLTPRNTFSVLVLAGKGDYVSGADKTTIPAETPFSSKNDSALLSATWQYTAGNILVWRTTGAWQRANDKVLASGGSSLEGSHYTEWTGNSNASIAWNTRGILQVGYSGRFQEDRGISPMALLENPAVGSFDSYRGSASTQSGYLQQTWSNKTGRIRLAAGLRGELGNRVSARPLLPYASVGLQVTGSAKMEFGWGQYAQFPAVNQVFNALGKLQLMPERSTHYLAAFEQRFGNQIRFRVEAYERDSRDLIDTPFLFPRLVNGSLVWPGRTQQVYNSARGYSRGIEVLLQRRSANRLSGWVSYSLGYARQRDGLAGISYAADDDQRSGVKLVLSYRIRPSINISTKWTYGTGTPVPGYFRHVSDLDYVLSNVRNGSRFPDYSRVDFRVNRSIVREKWKMTVYTEVVNAANHRNVRYLGIAVQPGNVVVPRIGTTVSLLPSTGISFEF